MFLKLLCALFQKWVLVLIVFFAHSRYTVLPKFSQGAEHTEQHDATVLVS